MASQPIPMEPKYIIDLIIKRRWILMVPFFIAMIVGIVLAIKLPKIYEASTLILIQPQRVPQNYVQPIVESDAGERINTLPQQVLSRTNLEKIIKDFNLFKNGEHSMFMEDMVGNLRKRISVNISTGRRRENDAFSISFQGQDPESVMRVTNALASYFIDENLRLREAQAVGTSDFLESELQNMKSRLEEVEAQLKRYRESYMGELPEQLNSNLQILDRLQEHLNESQQNLSEAKVRLAALQNTGSLSRETTVIIAQDPQRESNDIGQMRAELDSMLSRYTERHPDVVRLKARIAEMEKQAASGQQQSTTTSANSRSRQTAPLSAEYRIQYTEILQEMKRLETDIADTRAQIANYQKRVENTPKREQELLSLRRDYQNIQTTYDSLLERKLEAEIAVNMERKQKGEQFRIVDPAKLPQKPIKPDMRKLFIMIVGAGLAIGGGIIFLLEFVDNSFKRPEDIEEDLSLPVLCTIPRIINQRAKRMIRLEHISAAVFGFISLVLFAGFTFLTQLGVESTLGLLK
ncbi:GumC1 [Desulfosarcina cetonica]|nr:GumC1 [Desulfosarcina cetonica]